MFECTEIIISLKLEEYEPVKLFEEVLETPLKVDVDGGGNVIFLEAHETDDPIYPSFVSGCWDVQSLSLGKYANIKVVEKLYRKKKINSLIPHYGFIGNLDPQDPFWYLLHENGKWYLGDTSNSLLESPNGNPGVDKIAELDLTELFARKYIYDVNI